jgi:hypothetical protein
MLLLAKTGNAPWFFGLNTQPATLIRPDWTSGHQRPIKRLILRGRQVRVVPQQGEIAAVAQGPRLEGEHQVQRCIGVTQPQVPFGDHRTFHHDQRALAQRGLAQIRS